MKHVYSNEFPVPTQYGLQDMKTETQACPRPCCIKTGFHAHSGPDHTNTFSKTSVFSVLKTDEKV